MAKVQRTATGQSFMEPVGSYQQLLAATAVGLGTIPEGATLVMIQPETQQIRWRDDGVNPTATVGNLVIVNDTLFYTGNFASFKFIEVAVTTKVNVTFYR